MDTFVDFAWKNTVILGLFFVVYRFWLYPRKQFSFNRHFLLSGLLLSVVLPFISVKKVVQMTWNPLMAQGTFETVQQNGTDTISIEAVLMGIIGVGSACILGWIIVKLSGIIKLLIQAKTIQKTPPKLLLSNAVKGPFSFLNTIVFPTHLYRSEAYELILTHEKIHVKQWHSLDILLTNFLLVMAWWNPFLWAYRKTVVENLEFLTDQLTVATTKDLKTYQYILLKQTVPLDHLSLVHPFYHSFLKKRIMMLNLENNKKNPWASVLLAPLLVGFVFAFNTEVVAQIAPPPPPISPKVLDTIPPPPPPVYKTNGYSVPPPPPPTYEKKTASSTRISVAVTPTSTDEDLKGENGYKKLFNKYGVQLSFKKIKRNAAGEITGIKASFKSDNRKIGVYSVSGTEPISDFVFEVSLDQNDQLTEAVFKAAKSKSKVAKGYKSSRVVVRNEEGEILTENVYGSSDENIFIIKDTEGSSLTEKIEGLKGESIFIAKDLSGKVVSENILGSEGKNILVVRTGQKNKDSIMVIVRAEFDEDSLIDSEEQIELLVKKTKDMKAAKEQKAAKGQKMIVVKGAANSWTAESKNKPLIVVDGKIMDKGKNLNEIDPNSIESVNVLKGKSAQEKYGDKGVNGVIEVVTKKE
ncbi:MAG: M56 family metallopeptidase [Flavobacteriaceae bacterium]|nr:M56 family metallopeptidase [Flavobacteriaceae bacterium]